MLYETHYPQQGYKKVWPESLWCPICQRNGIIRDGAHKPLYVPKRGVEGGERMVYYVCISCYNRYRDLLCLTLKDIKDYHQCRLELETHLNMLNREDV